MQFDLNNTYIFTFVQQRVKPSIIYNIINI